MSLKKLFVLLAILQSVMFAQSKNDTSPNLFGYIKGWYQSDIANNQGSFLIKEARLGAKGKVNQYAGYKLFVDFTRLGNLQTGTTTINGVQVVTSENATFSNFLLDADVYLKPFENFTFDLGQFKIPFGTDNLRSGAEIDFVNRPLLTQVTPGLRDIGAMGTYSNSSLLPLEIKAGLFNGSGQNKTENDKTTNYALRTVVSPISDFEISGNYYGGKLSGVDVSIFDFGFSYRLNKIFIDGEYGQRNSELKNISTTSNSYFIYSYYDFDFGKSEISHIIPAVRYESFDPSTNLSGNEINRTTFGLALEFAKITYAQLRFNYELFDYKNGQTDPNKFIIEIITRF